MSPRINLFATTFQLLDPKTHAVTRACWRPIRIILWCTPGHLRSSSLIHRPTLCCRFRCCWSHCFMNRRSPRSNWVTLPHWRHRATQPATTLCLSLIHAAEDSCESSWHAQLQRLARTLQASVQARTRPRSRNSAQRLLKIAMHVVVTDQHCQRQTSSCIDIASLDSCTPIVKVRTCCIGVKHKLLTTPTPTSTVVSID